MLHFFGKVGKIAAALGAPHLKPPLTSGGWGLSPQTPQAVTPAQYKCDF